MESLELFAKDVMPEFKERDPGHRERKRERLAPAIEAAMSRRQPARPAPDYVIPPPPAPVPQAPPPVLRRS
jgi:hypothetical protein